MIRLFTKDFTAGVILKNPMRLLNFHQTNIPCFTSLSFLVLLISLQAAVYFDTPKLVDNTFNERLALGFNIYSFFTWLSSVFEFYELSVPVIPCRCM